MSRRSLTVLGSGTSTGVPMIGCDCAVCQSPDPKNRRTRPSVLFRLSGGNLLVDTTPELRIQLLREKVSIVHAVLFTHYHADHIMGLDDLRPIGKALGHAVPLYCSGETEGKIRSTFAYAFEAQAEGLPSGWVPKLRFERIDSRPFEALGEKVFPIPLIHSHFDVLGFRIGGTAYCTDVNEIPRTSWPLLEGLDFLILDCLRYKPHPGHFGLADALDVVSRFRPRQTYFTHLSHDFDHEEVDARLPSGVSLAYDGLTFDF
jgi:phosphoribosyl 1,2-cyclic phosphate phosphodiesterase